MSFSVEPGLCEINLLAEECRRIDESKWPHVSLVNELVTVCSLCKHLINDRCVCAVALTTCTRELCQQSHFLLFGELNGTAIKDDGYKRLIVVRPQGFEPPASWFVVAEMTDHTARAVAAPSAVGSSSRTVARSG